MFEGSIIYWKGVR